MGVLLFQSTLSMRRATSHASKAQKYEIISIHALHEESDCLRVICHDRHFPISIHALHEESDQSA